MDDKTLALATRDGLPEALRALLSEYPRLAWQAHPHFSGLVQFWLDRHLTFRKLMDLLAQDAEARIERSLAPDQYGQRLSRFGSMLVGQLHGHHQIEDDHYFPMLIPLDPRLSRGFEILDHDHHALGGLIDRFTRSANGVLSEPDESLARDAVAGFRGELDTFTRMLGRHLEDEEEIIVPVILKYGPGGLH